VKHAVWKEEVGIQGTEVHLDRKASYQDRRMQSSLKTSAGANHVDQSIDRHQNRQGLQRKPCAPLPVFRPVLKKFMRLAMSVRAKVLQGTCRGAGKEYSKSGGVQKESD